MTWFKVDDGLAFHPKVIAAGNAAMGLWVRAGSWSAQQLTDGFVPEGMVLALGGTPDDVAALVRVRLWVVEPGGWRFHEWNADGRQPTRAEVEGRKAKTASRVAAWRARQKQEQPGQNGVGNGVTGDVTPQPSNGVTGGVRNGPGNAAPDPTRPDPTRPQVSPSDPPDEAPPAAPRRNGARLPDGFRPDVGMLAWVRENCPGVPAAEHDRFVDYWRAQPGAKGRKADWPATWRNWMRRAQDDIAAGRRPSAVPQAPVSKTDLALADLAARKAAMRAARAAQADDEQLALEAR